MLESVFFILKFSFSLFFFVTFFFSLFLFQKKERKEESKVLNKKSFSINLIESAAVGEVFFLGFRPTAESVVNGKEF